MNDECLIINQPSWRVERDASEVTSRQGRGQEVEDICNSAGSRSGFYSFI